MQKVKKIRKYSKSYIEEVVQAALKDINYGMPKKQAAMIYGIPRSTLQFSLSDKFTKIEHGPRTYLTKDEENVFESWIFESHRKGFPKRRTHQTYELSQLCSNLKIILVSSYPNATRILQPADVSSFKPLKNAWKKAVIDWRRNNPYVQLTKVNFAQILEDASIQLKTDTVSNGFRACGLFPWNTNAIDFTNSIIFPEDNIVSLTFDEFTDFCDPETITEMKQGKPNEEIRGEMRHFKILQKIFNKFNVIEVDHRVRESSDMVIINDLPGQENIVDKSVPERSEMVLVETSPDKEFEVDQSAVEISNVVFDGTSPEHKEDGSELNELSDMDLGETSLEVNPTKDINLPVVDSYLSESEINDMSIFISADHTSAHLEYTRLTTENSSTSFSSLTIVDNTMIKELIQDLFRRNIPLGRLCEKQIEDESLVAQNT
ncbi:hypothetical protein JTB14_032043 [Gonioctena quinquepunctata]|nr:hypothetical protein JTB14_032043 [Gonioctena quinquepunctata]